MTFLQENYIYIIIILVVVLMTIIGYVADKKGFGKKEKSEKIKEKQSNNVSDNIEPVIQTDVVQNVNNIEEPMSLDDDFKMPDDLAPVEDTFNANNVSDEGLNFNDMESFDEPVSTESQEETSTFDSNEPTSIETNSVEPEVTPIDTFEMPIESVDSEPTTVDTTDEQPMENIFETNDAVEVPTEPAPIEKNSEVMEPVPMYQPQEPENTESNYNVDNGFSFDDIVEEEKTEPVVQETTEVVEPAPVEEPQPIEQPTEITPEEDFKLPSIDNLNQELQDVNSNDEDIWKF